MKCKATKSLVDIRLYPEPDVEQNMTEVTFGDLHANALLFLHSLVSQGFVEIPRKKYEQFAILYERDDLHPLIYHVVEIRASVLGRISLLYQVIAIFDELVKHITVVDKTRLIRLVGDELADRGVNDYFMIKLIELLHVQGARFEILLSNHGLEFIIACERFEKNNKQLKAPEITNVRYGHSLIALQATIASAAIKAEIVLDFYNNIYKKHLKILSYSLDINKNEIQIFSHAGIGFVEIASLAELLGVPCSMHCVADMAKSIDLINQEFITHVNEDKLHNLYFKEVMDEKTNQKTLARTRGISDIIWNRKYDHLQRHSMAFAVKFIHGHDSNNEQDPIHLTLNSELGKLTNYCGTFECYTTNGRNYAMILDNWISTLDDMSGKALQLYSEGEQERGKEAHNLYLTLSKKSLDLYPKNPEIFRQECHQALCEAHDRMGKYKNWTGLLLHQGMILDDLVKESACEYASQICKTSLFFKNIEQSRLIGQVDSSEDKVTCQPGDC